LTGLAVGFDLDMTLIDSRPGIAETFRLLGALTGVAIDTDAVVARLGPPLEQEIARWYPSEQVTTAAARYRELYPDHAVVPSPALPGAPEALAAVRAAGGRVVVVTAKMPALAELHLRHLGLPFDELYGFAWADGKSAALKAAGATAYVGDHVADMAAAREAGVFGIGVTTGPCSAGELVVAGADAVLPDLRGFPPLLAQIQLGHGDSGG
jgi:phosphoglycolate phosphatase